MKKTLLLLTLIPGSLFCADASLGAGAGPHLERKETKFLKNKRPIPTVTIGIAAAAAAGAGSGVTPMDMGDDSAAPVGPGAGTAPEKQDSKRTSNLLDESAYVASPDAIAAALDSRGPLKAPFAELGLRNMDPITDAEVAIFQATCKDQLPGFSRAELMNLRREAWSSREILRNTSDVSGNITREEIDLYIARCGMKLSCFDHELKRRRQLDSPEEIATTQKALSRLSAERLCSVTIYDECYKECNESNLGNHEDILDLQATKKWLELAESAYAAADAAEASLTHATPTGVAAAAAAGVGTGSGVTPMDLRDGSAAPVGPGARAASIAAGACAHPSCKKPALAGACAGCKQVDYCSAECQKAHWQTHKKVCKELHKNIVEKMPGYSWRELTSTTKLDKDKKHLCHPECIKSEIQRRSINYSNGEFTLSPQQQKAAKNALSSLTKSELDLLIMQDQVYLNQLLGKEINDGRGRYDDRLDAITEKSKDTLKGILRTSMASENAIAHAVRECSVERHLQLLIFEYHTRPAGKNECAYCARIPIPGEKDFCRGCGDKACYCSTACRKAHLPMHKTVCPGHKTIMKGPL